jgi:hypothetical protein
MIYTWGELLADDICRKAGVVVGASSTRSTAKDSAAYILDLADRIKNERAALRAAASLPPREETK